MTVFRPIFPLPFPPSDNTLHFPMIMIQNNRSSLTAIVFAGFLGTAGIGGVNIAIPLIAGDLNASLSMVSWVISGYLLVLAGFCVITGRIADRRGLKRTFLDGTILYTAASVLCYLSPDILVLIAARILQAAGAAMFIATGPALVAAIMPRKNRGAGLSYFNAAALAGTVAGMGVGGIVSDTFGWRVVFPLLAVLGLAAFLLGREGIPTIPPQQQGAPFDIPGSVFFFSAMTTLLAGLSLDSLPIIPDTIPHLLYFVSLVLWALLILHSRHTPSPVLDFSLFRDRQFSLAVTARMVMDITLGGITFFLPFILTLGLDLSIAAAGLVLMIAGGLSILVAPVAGHLADRFGSRPACGAAGFFTLCILAGFLLLSRQSPLLIILLAILFRISVAAYSTPSAKLILDHTPPGRSGAASGIMQTGRYAAYTVGIAVFIIVFEAGVYGAGLPCDGTPILPRLTVELLRPGYVALFTAAFLVTLSALLLGLFARDRTEGSGETGRAEEDAGRAGF